MTSQGFHTPWHLCNLTLMLICPELMWQTCSNAAHSKAGMSQDHDHVYHHHCRSGHGCVSGMLQEENPTCTCMLNILLAVQVLLLELTWAQSSLPNVSASCTVMAEPGASAGPGWEEAIANCADSAASVDVPGRVCTA